MFSSTLLILTSLLCTPLISVATTPPSQTTGQTIALSRRQPDLRTTEEWSAWAKKEREALIMKYGGSPPSKRSEGTNLMINQGSDSSYIGSLAIGTPPIAFYVILDTGSSDLWVTDVNCVSGCTHGDTSYNPSSSSSFHNLSQPFSATYGGGQAAGDLVSDDVQMAGFMVKNQVFGAVTQLSDGLLSSPVSGLLGLGWQSIATTGQPPFWQTLASKGSFSEPVMAFQLTRFGNDSSAHQLEPGGSFTMGFLNSSLYTGNIDYQKLVTTPGFWILQLTGITVQGSHVSLPSGSASYAAIDTGTSLIGCPPNQTQSIYAQIPGSQPGTGDLQGFWIYPCNTKVNVTMSFGGPSWSVSPADFQFKQVGSNQCVGAFFDINLGGDAPSWIVGDTFLKNVYSVFRFDPPSVGFAALSADAVEMNGVDGRPPTATIGSVIATSTSNMGGASSWTSGTAFELLAVVCGMTIFLLLPLVDHM